RRAPSGESGDVLGWHGLAEEEALPVVAAQRAQEAVLLAGLDALRRHTQAQALAQGDDRPQQVDVLTRRAVAQLVDEAAVDLQAVERQLAQVRERRLSHAEVVERDVNAHLPDLGETLHVGRQGIYRGAFAHLDLEQAGVQVVARQRRFDGRREVVSLQGLRADVDGDPPRRSLALPAAGLQAGPLR